jgi:hypothetical protein
MIRRKGSGKEFGMGDETGSKGVNLGLDLVVHVRIRLVVKEMEMDIILRWAIDRGVSAIGWQGDERVDRPDASMRNGGTDCHA